MGRDHQHGPVLHLGLLLQKAVGLRCQTVAELFDLQCFKAIELITGSCRVELQCVGKACF